MHRKGDKLKLISSNEEIKEKKEKNGEFLCKVNPFNDYYGIDLNHTNRSTPYDIDNIPWLLLRDVFNGERGYRIHEGDLFKVGKFILKVRQIRLKSVTLQKTMSEYKDTNTQYIDEDNSKNIFNTNKSFLKCSTINKDVLLLAKKLTKQSMNQNGDENQNKPTCRICLGEEYDEENPLINPCKCSGTMKYLHLNCLKMLINSKIEKIYSDTVSLFTFKSLECEICKSLFPENILVKNKTYTIIDLQRPTTNYMIIEGIVKENLETKSIFIIKLLEHTQIKIGRASDADVRLNDISVSRCHAIIRLCDGFCVLSDTKSKYGTLVNTGNKLCVLPKKPLTIVKENTMLKFRMDMKLCCLLSCYRPKNIPYKNYNIFFERVWNTKCRIKDNPSLLWSETQIVSEYEGKKSIIKKLDKKKCIDNSQIAEEDKIDIPVSSQENYKCK